MPAKNNTAAEARWYRYRYRRYRCLQQRRAGIGIVIVIVFFTDINIVIVSARKKGYRNIPNQSTDGERDKPTLG